MYKYICTSGLEEGSKVRHTIERKRERGGDDDVDDDVNGGWNYNDEMMLMEFFFGYASKETFLFIWNVVEKYLIVACYY